MADRALDATTEDAFEQGVVASIASMCRFPAACRTCTRAAVAPSKGIASLVVLIACCHDTQSVVKMRTNTAIHTA